MKKTICFNIINICEKGGEERICTMLANNLVELGYDIHIISFYAENGLTPFYHISDKIHLYNLLPNVNERRVHQYLGWHGYAQWKYKRYMQKHHIDIIIDVATVRSPFTTPIAMELGIKHIAWDHFCYQYFLERPTYKKILPCLQNGVDKLVVLTDIDKSNYIKLAHVLADKVVRIYNFSPIEEENIIQHNSQLVLAMGRLSKEKGFDLLLQAWAIVEKENKDWQLEIVGNGPERNSLLAQISDLNLEHVTLSPATSDPRSKYEQASIFALPSRIEGLGLTLIEAANMSLPIVAFYCDNGPKELLRDRENGMVVPEGDTRQMALRLLELMNSRELREDIGRNAFATIGEIKQQNIVNQWVELIESI